MSIEADFDDKDDDRYQETLQRWYIQTKYLKTSVISKMLNAQALQEDNDKNTDICVDMQLYQGIKVSFQPTQGVFHITKG